MQRVTVRAHANIALNKYWGKRDEKLFLPTKSSFSVGVDALQTETSVEFGTGCDQVYFSNQAIRAEANQKIIDFLNLFRSLYGVTQYFTVTTQNLFPIGAGLASSASGFAALALALDALCGLKLSREELSILARRGSGSASRSIMGGFAVWHKGSRADGLDSFAEQLYPATHWPEFRILIAVVSDQEKTMSSRVGMQTTVASSPSYNSWIDQSEERLTKFIAAVGGRNVPLVGELTEEDWHGWQCSVLDSTPSINYWTPQSRGIIEKVQTFRRFGVGCFFTTDAGPNVKIFCEYQDAAQIKRAIETTFAVPVIISSIAADPVVLAS